MFILKFFASIFFIIFLLVVLFLVFTGVWIRNIKRQFDRLGRSSNSTKERRTGDDSRRTHDTRCTTVNDNEGEYVDFEEVS